MSNLTATSDPDTLVLNTVVVIIPSFYTNYIWRLGFDLCSTEFNSPSLWKAKVLTLQGGRETLNKGLFEDWSQQVIQTYSSARSITDLVFFSHVCQIMRILHALITQSNTYRSKPQFSASHCPNHFPGMQLKTALQDYNQSSTVLNSRSTYIIQNTIQNVCIHYWNLYNML